MPSASNHEAKSKKIMNSGVVSFTLRQAVDEKGNYLYGIDPVSVTVVYGGFTTK